MLSSRGVAFSTTKKTDDGQCKSPGLRSLKEGDMPVSNDKTHLCLAGNDAIKALSYVVLPVSEGNGSLNRNSTPVLAAQKIDKDQKETDKQTGRNSANPDGKF